MLPIGYDHFCVYFVMICPAESDRKRRVSVGQDVSWVVMADPDGNEFDVLRAFAPDELPAD